MKYIGEILLNSGILNPEQYKIAEADSRLHSDKSIGDILIDKGFLNFDSIINYLNREIDKKR